MKSIDDVAAYLRSRPGKLRVQGSGSNTCRARASDDTSVLSLRGLDRIVRLDAGDQTCTVEAGVLRRDLDSALAEHELELPCLGGGTIGGLVASDPIGPAANGAFGPRNLLLGMDALLADGTPFRSGARVVKSVAGFDVHKVFVGSAGTLLVAARLHLRLKPAPRAQQWFCNDGLGQKESLALAQTLRIAAVPPAVLQIGRDRSGSYCVRGRLAGREQHIAATRQRHQLRPTDPIALHDTSRVHLAPATDNAEIVRGIALLSALPQLLAALPNDAPFAWLDGGRFEAELADAAHSDAFFAKLPADKAAAAVAIGPDERRERGTVIAPVQQQLATQLKQALDPDGILV